MENERRERYYLFNWDDIPGKDSIRLIDHLEKCQNVKWGRKAEIKKSVDKKTIKIFDGKNLIIFRLNEENNIAIMESEGKKTYEYYLRKESGKLKIYNKEIFLILRGLDYEDDEELEYLAEDIIRKSRKETRDLVDILHSGNEDDSRKAGAVLLGIGDLALTPLLEAVNEKIPEDCVWDMQTSVNIQIENRLRIARELEKMLVDKRQLKLPILPPGTEESPIPRRVCDEAYLMMRRLLAFEENEEELFFNTDIFLNMSDEEKDDEINRALISKRWTSLTEQFSGTEE